MLNENNLFFAYQFSDLEIQPANEWVDEQFIDTIEPHYISYISALAAILAVKYLLRI